MSRKNIIIIAIIIAILIVVLVWIIISSQKTTPVSSPASPSSSSQTGTNINSGTTNPGNNTSSFPVNNTPSNSSNINGNPNYKNLTISDPNNHDQTKKKVIDFASKPSTNDFTQIVYDNGQIVPLETFANAMNLKINPDLNNLLNNEDYQLIKCPEDPNSFGIMFNIRLFPDRPNIYRETKAIMKNWEETIFQDIHPIIFPGVDFDAKDDLAKQKLTFKDGRYRYAEVMLPDGSKSSINYSIIFDSITITNSPNCLAKISAKVETLEP